MVRKVTILGAGLVGSLLSIILRKRGYDVSLYERRKDMRSAAIAAGKSINLATSARGWKALETAGLKNEIEEIVHTIAPHVKINITLFPSTEEYLEQFSNKKIDLLTAIRVEDHESDIADALERLENKMADDSGMLICSASDNTIKTKCFRKKRERSILPPKHLELNEGSPEMLFLKELNEFKGLLIGSNMGQQRSKNRLISKGWVKNHP